MLTSCPDCGKPVSTAAAHCPHCGAPAARPAAPLVVPQTAPAGGSCFRNLLILGCASVMLAVGAVVGLPLLGFYAFTSRRPHATPPFELTIPDEASVDSFVVPRRHVRRNEAEDRPWELAGEWQELAPATRERGAKTATFVRLRSVTIGGDFAYFGREEIRVLLVVNGAEHLLAHRLLDLPSARLGTFAFEPSDVSAPPALSSQVYATPFVEVADSKDRAFNLVVRERDQLVTRSEVAPLASDAFGWLAPRVREVPLATIELREYSLRNIELGPDAKDAKGPGRDVTIPGAHAELELVRAPVEPASEETRATIARLYGFVLEARAASRPRELTALVSQADAANAAALRELGASFDPAKRDALSMARRSGKEFVAAARPGTASDHLEEELAHLDTLAAYVAPVGSEGEALPRIRALASHPTSNPPTPGQLDEIRREAAALVELLAPAKHDASSDWPMDEQEDDALVEQLREVSVSANELLRAVRALPRASQALETLRGALRPLIEGEKR